MRLNPRFNIAAVCFVLPAVACPAAEQGYCSQPALHDTRIVFVCEGDLWHTTIPAADSAAAGTANVAYRLTTSEGEESRPAISPDGKWLAFSGQYDGNVDVFVMPIDGGAPARLTFHPDPDTVLGWTPDGRSVLFRSTAMNPLGRPELYRVSTHTAGGAPSGGGMPIRYDFGECSLASLSSTGQRIAFNRWSNEHWTWKRYRGGTAPEIWVGDFGTNSFTQLTSDAANDLFPMWVLGRVFFISDRTGTANLFSDQPEGGDLKQHTQFASVAGNPTAIDGYDIRWPSADANRHGSKIIFTQGAQLALFDAVDGSVRRLDVQLASDRPAARQRFADPMETATEYELSPDGKTLLVGSRGEILSVPLEPGQAPLQLSRSSDAREWGASYLDDDTIVLISDAGNEQQIATVPADGSAPAGLTTEDREAWLFPPQASPDGQWIAFADKTQRLHIMNMQTLQRRQIDQSEAWEIRDYRFSPDSKWLAYVKPMPNAFGTIMLYAVETGRTFQVSSSLTNDSEPRWDPAGKYLYFLSQRHLDPMMGDLDFEHIYLSTTRIYALPLSAATPPPNLAIAKSVGFDLEEWGEDKSPKDEKDKDKKGDDDKDDAKKDDDGEEKDEKPPGAPEPMIVDTEGMMDRHYALPIEAGEYRGLEALWGSICYLEQPRRGLLYDDFGKSGIGEGQATLHRYDLTKETKPKGKGKDEEEDGPDKTLAEDISGYTINAHHNVIAYPKEDGFNIIKPGENGGGEKPRHIDVSDIQLRINAPAEWKQIFNEAWRLQRDFYWAPNYQGVDWPAMKVKYEALLPRIGTRAELNDLIGQMIGELGTSHTYIWGGQPFRQPKAVSVGMLGADIEFDGRAFRIKRIIPGQSWDEKLISPLSEPYLKVKENSVLLAINGIALTPQMNVYDLLQDQADKEVRLAIADDEAGANKRTIQVKTLKSEKDLRYFAWVEANRKYVEEKSEGKLGYLHIPDMGGDGLVAFSRLFYPQFTKQGLVVDIRDNGGGFVSQMIIERLNRKVWAFMQPRHGIAERYPVKALYGYMAVLIDQHAGSDGDIFPASFRLNDMGPLIGTRTWGGVVGIRADKPFVDFGLSTQPEFAFWSPKDGWSIENRGVPPDIEVVITPNDRIAGRDPQLERGIEWLLEKLKNEPKPLPTMPPWPTSNVR